MVGYDSFLLEWLIFRGYVSFMVVAHVCSQIAWSLKVFSFISQHVEAAIEISRPFRRGAA